MTASPYIRFERQIKIIIDARNVLNSSIPKSKSGQIALEYSIQGLYLVAVRSFESYLEEQIIALATKKQIWKSRILGDKRERFELRLQEHRPKFVHELILNGRKYADYLPFEQTQSIANKLFVGGRPFALVSNSEKSLINRCVKVRHCIAHDSSHSRKQFLSAYSAVKRPRRRSPLPIDYLEDQIRRGTTFFEHDIAALSTIARLLS